MYNTWSVGELSISTTHSFNLQEVRSPVVRLQGWAGYLYIRVPLGLQSLIVYEQTITYHSTLQ